MRAAALAILLLLGACGGPSVPPPPIPVRAAGQGTPAPAAAAPQPRPRLWYLGLGMQGETWSENDVAETATRLAQVATAFDVTPVILSNPLPGRPPRYPAVTTDAVEQATAAIAAQAAPGDVVLIYASTHGAPGLLAREAAGRPLPPVGIDGLRRWLAPLGDRDTVLILSACFSGSFIPALQAEHRIIFTAARADRTSFGCQAGAEHTVFGDALLGALEPGSSLQVVVDKTRDAVTAEERQLGVRLPSFPQVSVGPAVEGLYAAPVF